MKFSGGDIWTSVERIAAIVTMIGLPYLVYDRRKRLPYFHFIFGGSHGESFQQDNLTFARMTFTGSIQNRSLDPNTVERVWLVVWRTKRKRGTRRYGYGGTEVRDEQGNLVGPPIRFQGRESKKVTITCEFPLTGTGDAQIYGVQMPLAGNPNFAIARYTYELAFEDVGGNLFDQNGLPRSRKTIDLLWTFDNAWEQLKDGHPGVFIRHGAAVIAEDIKFTLKRLLRTTLGL